MTKRLTHFVSLLLHFKRVCLVMGVTTVLLLSGSSQILAVSLSDDQQKTVSGRITDSSNEALPGVNVLEKGTTNGVMADVDGKFTLNVASASSILVFSSIGYTA